MVGRWIPSHGGTTALAVVAAAGALALAPSSAVSQTELCLEAERFVREVMDMAALAEPDTIDDWRTGKVTPGCRVTAAGATRRSASDVVGAFYARVEEEGWTRTPDPRDAPNEASMRYRRSGADCLFNYYGNETTLATEAELVVSEAVPRRPGESLYNFLILCVPAAQAAPRGDSP